MIQFIAFCWEISRPVLPSYITFKVYCTYKSTFYYKCIASLLKDEKMSCMFVTQVNKDIIFRRKVILSAALCGLFASLVR